MKVRAAGVWAMAVVAAVAAVGAVAAVAAAERHAFYRELGRGDGGHGGDGGEERPARRIFGGAAAELEEFPWVVALLDRYWAARCSGAALADHWVLTAAHCVTPRLAYVKYNTRRPASPDGDFAPVLYLYRHPEFEVVQTRGAEADVTRLRHDVGLVRTRARLRLRRAPPPDLRAALERYDPDALAGEEVQVLGFGRTERSVLGEELLGARLRLAACRGDWLHVACAAAAGAAGVCSGDSGGPVLYRGQQIGVTSMGPVACARAAGAGPGAGASSVLTVLRPYAALVADTVAEAEAALRMARLAAARAPAPPPLLLLLPPLLPPLLPLLLR